MTRTRVLGSETATALADAAALAHTAAPIVAIGLLNMTISITDTWMIAAMDPRALGTAVIVSDFYSIVFYFASGVLAAVTPLAANAIGGRRPAEVGRVLAQALALLTGLAIVGAVLIGKAVDLVAPLGIGFAEEDAAEAYAGYMAWAYVAMLIFALARGLVAAMERSRLPMLILVAAAPLNAGGNYVLMHGALGFPELGLAGAGASSLIVALFCAAALWTWVLAAPAARAFAIGRGLRSIDAAGLARMARMGAMIALATIAETGVFLSATIVMGMVAAEALPAHAIVFRVVAVCYCVTVGLSQAATIRIGLAHGASDAEAEGRVRRAARALSVGLALIVAALFWFAPACLAAAVGDADGGRIARDIELLMPLAGLAIAVLVPGNVAMGILRGRTDVTVPAALTLGGYWLVGFGGMATAAMLGTLDAAGIWMALGAGTAAASLGTCLYLAARLRPSGGAGMAAAAQPA